MIIRELEPKQSVTGSKRRGRLCDLAKVELTPHDRAILDFAVKHSGGDAAWKGRKRIEAQEILSLGQIAPPDRLTIQFVDMHEALRVLMIMKVPVPRQPDSANKLRIADHAVLGFTYPPEAVRMPLPGPAFFQILEPQDVWLPQVAPGIQRHCIAETIPAGTPCKELILMAYGALSMQSVQVDEFDAAGVFNGAAARWWQQNMDRIPLTRTPFLAADGVGEHFEPMPAEEDQT